MSLTSAPAVGPPAASKAATVPAEVAARPLGLSRPAYWALALAAGCHLRRRYLPRSQRRGPELLAALGNGLLGLLRRAGHAYLAAALGYDAWQPGTAFRQIGLTP